LIQGNHVHNLTVSGGCTGSGGAGIVDATYTGSDDDIIGNVVHDIGVPGSCNGVQGIYHSNLRGKIANNIVYRVSAYGIHLWHAANNVTIVNNSSFANGSSSMGGGIVVGRGDSGAGIMTNTLILNNIVYNNPRSGISQYCYTGDNCIGSGNVVANNLVYGSSSAISLKVGSATNTIAADPQFVNYKFDGTGDFHLKSTSPAIDKGTSSSAPKTDIDNTPRPQGAGIDIGAYEFSSTSTTTVTPKPVLTLSANTLDFGSQLVGTTSAIQTLTLKNTGTANMTIPSGFVISGDFAFGGTGTCAVGVSYAPGASCTASLVFKPQATGTRSGTISIITNASSTPVVVKLTGVGTVPAPIVKLSASSLTFANQKVGTTSTVQIFS
jgi:hypothetical protein